MTEVEIGGCSNKIKVEVGSTERVGSDEVELGEVTIDSEGDGSIATSDSVAVDVTTATVGEAELLISIVLEISIDVVG